MLDEVADAAQVLRTVKPVSRAQKLVLLIRERRVSENVAQRQLLQVDRSCFDGVDAGQHAARVSRHVREAEVTHLLKFDPLAGGDLVFHLHVDRLIAVVGLEQADKVQVLLAPLVLVQLAEAEDADEVRLDAGLLPDLPDHSFLDRLIILDEAARELPKRPKLLDRLALLDAQDALFVLAEDEAADPDVVRGEARYLVLLVRGQPLRHHQVVVLRMVQ